MMKNLTLEHIAQVCGGVWHGPDHLLGQCVKSITTDSRSASPGCLFVPIVGERADGHAYIDSVQKKGALATLSERELPGTDFPYIRVTSSREAVKTIAAYYLDQLEIPVVGITGSVGKTSTKEMIAAVLGKKYRVLKTPGNFNNELGLPLTVFRLREEDEIAVLEMGISDFGEMHRLAAIARPKICVITNIGTCHLENLGDRDGVLRAKTEIFDHLRENAAVILNGDDDKLATVERVQGRRPVFFGLSGRHDVWADRIGSRGLSGVACRIHTPQGDFDVTVPLPGTHMVYNALAGTAVGLACHMSLEEISAGIESLEPLSGRFHIIEGGAYTVIDDCYNANPMSMKASLGVLAGAAGRRAAILGDMGELGEKEKELHAEVGAFAGTCGIDLLICVGPLAGYLADAAERSAHNAGQPLQVVHLDTVDELSGALPQYLKTGDTVLVKASHFMNFGRIVEALTKNPV